MYVRVLGGEPQSYNKRQGRSLSDAIVGDCPVHMAILLA